ncbi:MAG: 4Fe-4S dicluster domain-containing protein [Spirochaetes bacterium]|nr:4Fe-4S dicluster domain-containing protein [Spirochaetota bacterium]
MKYVILKKNKLDEFIVNLSKQKKVMAPVSKGYNNYAFEEVTRGGQIALKYIPTILPPKKYFMPQYETVVEYDTKDGKQNMEAIVEYDEMILFGVHTCDLAGIQSLNVVFSDRPKDLNYIIRKNKIILIGLECNDYCDEHASCKLVNNELPNGGYDLFFTDLGDFFLVHVNTWEGENLISLTKVFEPADDIHMKKREKLRAKKREIFKNEVKINPDQIPDLFDRSHNSKVWYKLGERCLSCGNCTNVCPTCHCFDVEDEINLDLKTGKRIRIWDSCQHESFAKVAGGENFRRKAAGRQRHRYFRKFKYPVDKFSRYFCTGCGRCSRTCMADIRLKETLDDLIKESI